MAQPILMTEDYWANSQFSVVRHTGRMQWNGVRYIICNEEGKDIFQCSIEAEKAGRDKAIEPGEPCDLIDERYKGGTDRYCSDYSGPNEGGTWDTYEQAALAGIEYVLDNLI